MRRLAVAVALLALLPAGGLGKDPPARRLRHRRAAHHRHHVEPERPDRSELDSDLGLRPGPDRDYDGVPDARTPDHDHTADDD